jgi:hypothetical protein
MVKCVRSRRAHTLHFLLPCSEPAPLLLRKGKTKAAATQPHSKYLYPELLTFPGPSPRPRRSLILPSYELRVTSHELAHASHS